MNVRVIVIRPARRKRAKGYPTKVRVMSTEGFIRKTLIIGWVYMDKKYAKDRVLPMVMEGIEPRESTYETDTDEGRKTVTSTWLEFIGVE